MPRYAITIEYDGTGFVGWQMQENGPSIQAALGEALAALTGREVQVFGAGRTDAGVHALGQVAHFDLTRDWAEDKLRDGLNFHLKPAAIAVLEARLVADEFDARFSATARTYLYRILNRRAPLALDRDRVWHVGPKLEPQAMHDAAQCLTGQHDFTTFRAVQCQAKSPVKTLDEITVSRNGEEIATTVKARSFLHHQVRSIVGSLKLVGTGKWSAVELERALKARHRSACGQVAPAHGLYLVAVDYDGSAPDQDAK
jgi:tRNA pseudouridine38-40 synthase